MNNVNTLFYSERCSTCQDLLLLLKNDNILQCFKLMCIDGKETLYLKYFSRTPALSIVNYPKILCGKEIFIWLHNLKSLNKQQTLNKQENGPKGYITDEMTGISDNFSYMHNDIAQPKSFLNYNKENNDFIYTAPELENKIKSEDQKKYLQQYNKNRKQTELQINEKMENERNEILNKYKNI
jgi:hypothetical protein